MRKLLVIDAGSSKTDWSVIEETGKIERWKSEGINPLLAPSELISHIIENTVAKINKKQFEAIYYYGAGCLDEKQKNIIQNILKSVLYSDQIHVNSDMLGIAKALYHDGNGIAAILGTGSNTCLFENGKITDKIPSLGFILGDEGSGASLGKRLITYVYKKQLPHEVIKSFHREFPFSIEEIIERVYRQPVPSAFLASFAPFILRNSDNTSISNLILEEFESFFKKNILPYKTGYEVPVSFAGSIAFYFNIFIREVAKNNNIVISNIIKDPMPELEKYYYKKFGFH
ncbi:MAG: ATPase [Muribaculaceae bacterium]|nr:ATPase [Muribaculaceae bacterium]